MPDWVLQAANLGFSIIVAGVLLKFLMNDVSHDLKRIIHLLEKQTKE